MQRFSLLILALIFAPLLAAAQDIITPKGMPEQSSVVDTLSMSQRAISFRQANVFSPDTTRATLRVRVYEKGGSIEPVQGATVLLRRDDDKMMGRVTLYDGRCQFSPSPSTYTVRVQMTGLKSIEQPGYTLEAGKVYDMEIRMDKH